MEPHDPIAGAHDPTPAPPLPVQSLDYSTPPRSGRPGILTAVGVVSIVIGALSVLMACSSLFTSIAFQVMPRMAAGTVTVTSASSSSSTTTTTTTATTMPAFPFPARDTTALVMGVSDAVLRLALAVLVILAGILVLRDHRLGRKLHLIWAWVKIPASLFAAVAYMFTMRGMFSAMPVAPGSPVTPQFMSTMMLLGGLMQAAIACAYPVGVLIVMKTRTVREFYRERFGITAA